MVASSGGDEFYLECHFREIGGHSGEFVVAEATNCTDDAYLRSVSGITHPVLGLL